jgi:hypothetical protein
MKKIILCALTILVASSQAYGHSGRTDKNGGHNCSKKSIEKGLCTGYHYHNGKSYSDDAKDHEGHASAHKNDLKTLPIVSARAPMGRA